MASFPPPHDPAAAVASSRFQYYYPRNNEQMAYPLHCYDLDPRSAFPPRHIPSAYDDDNPYLSYPAEANYFTLEISQSRCRCYRTTLIPIILSVCFHLVATACKKASRSHLSLMPTERRVYRVDAAEDGGNEVAEEERRASRVTAQMNGYCITSPA